MDKDQKESKEEIAFLISCDLGKEARSAKLIP